jgi:YgiT-type zinc finger domain-containing protein
MKCVICKHGHTGHGKTTVLLTKSKVSVIIREVPADICENCGEYYLDEKTTQKVLQIAQQAVERNVELEICDFAA